MYILLLLGSVPLLVLDLMVDRFHFRMYFFLLISVDLELSEEFGQLFLDRIATLLTIDHFRTLFPALRLHILELVIELLDLVVDCCNLEVILTIIKFLKQFLWHRRNDRVHCDIKFGSFKPPFSELILAKTRHEFALANKGSILSRGVFSLSISGQFSLFSCSHNLLRLLFLLLLFLGSWR